MSRNGRLIATAALVLVIVAGVVVLVAGGDDDNDVRVSATTTTSTVESTTTTAPAPADLTAAVWPWASSSTRYSDPVAAATGFATDFVGFVDPVVGEFRAGDGRSGEVDVRMKANLVPTTVLVRQLGSDGTWWVIGASTPNIQVEAPTAGQVVASPIAVRGTSTAFEGTVAVDIREDGNPNPISVNGYVTGGANGEFGPFDETVTFSAPTVPYGAVVFSTSSAETGQVFEATVIRVAFSTPG